jgi:hypothetical protein
MLHRNSFTGWVRGRIIFSFLANLFADLFDVRLVIRETNLKIYKAPPATNSLSPEEVVKIQGKLSPGGPDEQLYEWKANMEIENAGTTSLKHDNLLLRVRELF